MCRRLYYESIEKAHVVAVDEEEVSADIKHQDAGRLTFYCTVDGLKLGIE